MEGEHQASRTAREEALRRLFDLPWRDMYAAWTAVGSYLLAGQEGETREQKLLRERAEALDDMASAARELDLPAGQWPGVDDYQRVAKRLGLRYSSHQVIRRWEYWDAAGAALVGQRTSETPHQRAIRRASSGRRRTHEQYLAGLRDWLATNPPSRTTPDYDAWADGENARRDPTHTPYVTAAAITGALAINWRTALAVAEYELDLNEAQQRSLKELADAAGPLGLVSARGVALILGTNAAHVTELANKPGFPDPAALLGRTRVWYRTDIEAHHAGAPVPRRKAGELDDQLMTSADVRQPLGMRADSFIAAIHRRHWHLVPQPAGYVPQMHYWLREDVERWLTEHPERLAANRRRQPTRGGRRPAKSAAQ